MRIILIITFFSTCTYFLNAQIEVPLTFECIETPFHVDEIYQTLQMHCDDGVLSYGDDDPCSDIYYERGFIFYTARFKHEENDNPVGTFGDIYFHEDVDGETYVELHQARMFITTAEIEAVNSIKLEIRDYSQNGFVFDYNKPSELVFYNSFEELDEAFPNVHWDGTFLLIDEPVTEFQIGADHLVAKNIVVNPATTTSIYSKKIETKVFAYPNPTADILSIDLGEERMIGVEIYDLHGKMLLQDSQRSDSKVHVGNLNSGIYFAKVTTVDGKIYVQQFAKL